MVKYKVIGSFGTSKILGNKEPGNEKKEHKS